MGTISLRCPACNRMVKFPEEKAGLNAECTRCGELVTVPSLKAAAEEKPAETPAAAASNDDDEDDGDGNYEVLSSLVADKKPKAPEKKKKKKGGDKPAIQRRKKKINDPELWLQVRSGLLFWNIGGYVWAIAFGLQMLVVLLGVAAGPEFGPLRLMYEQEQDLARYAIGLVSGTGLLSVAMLLSILVSVLLLVKFVICGIGYGVCMGGVDRFGMRGQCTSMLILAGVNLVLQIFFVLLPLLGVVSFTLLPVVAPTVPCLNANLDRVEPLQVQLASSPFWETLLSFVILFTFYFEPVLSGVYMRAAGLSAKDTEFTESGTGLTKLGMGTMFILLAFNLLAVCGTSDVMLALLRLAYILWASFVLLFIIRFIQITGFIRNRLGDLLEGLVFEDDDDEEEEEERPRKRRRKRKRRDEVDDDEDD